MTAPGCRVRTQKTGARCCLDWVARALTHRKVVLVGWLLALVAVVAISSAAGSSFNESLNLPGTDSQAAVTLLEKNFPAASGESDQVVVHATHGTTVRSPTVRAAVTDALARVARVPGVAAVSSPFSPRGASQISRDATVAFATVTWSKQTSAITTAEAGQLVHTAESADRPDVRVSLGGPAISNWERPSPGSSVLVGVVAALLILLLVFGGALAASLMPLAAAVLALGIATSAVGILSRLMAVPSFGTDLAILLGLGVGVDYGLFIVSRHRSAVKAGLSYEEAAAQAVNTSGRTVVFAGLTVCIALLGQFALGVSFLYGLSISAAVTVGLTMSSALTFLPAMLGFLGAKALARRERAASETGDVTTSDVSRFWLRWAKLVEAHKVLVAVGSLAVVVVLALPIFGLRLGSSDAATDPPSSTTHQAYVALARGFGPGFNGPLELVGEVRSRGDIAAFDRLLATAAHTPGVASITPAASSPSGTVVLATLYPSTSPEAQPTVDLVNHLRNDVIPQAEQGSTLPVHVGGSTATNIDFAHVLSSKLLLFVGVVVLLAFLLLMVVFRSLVIPLVASLMNLLSIGAALGALNAVFNWGYGHSLLGLSGTGPVDAFIPVLMFSVLFGLSMDYEVYLVSRIQEEWHRLGHAVDASVVTDRAGSPTQPPGYHDGPGRERSDHRGSRRHHDLRLRLLLARRPARHRRVRIRPGLLGPRRRPSHPKHAGAGSSCTSSGRSTGPCRSGWTAVLPQTSIEPEGSVAPATGGQVGGMKGIAV